MLCFRKSSPTCKSCKPKGKRKHQKNPIKKIPKRKSYKKRSPKKYYKK